VELHSLHLYQLIFSLLGVKHEDNFICIAMTCKLIYFLFVIFISLGGPRGKKFLRDLQHFWKGNIENYLKGLVCEGIVSLTWFITE
jgi:hypothetical protein